MKQNIISKDILLLQSTFVVLLMLYLALTIE